MLRRFTPWLGALLLVAGVIAAICQRIFAIHLLFLGLLLTLGVIFEAWRYKRTLSAPPANGAVATGERFIDPTSGERVEVYSDPKSGERSYVTLPTHKP